MKLNIVISIHDSVKKNIKVFKLIIYVQEDFQFLLIKMHTNENRFRMIKEDENKYAQIKNR